MATRGGTSRKSAQIQGLILPKTGEHLKALWRAFETGSTWYRVGKKSRRKARFVHASYPGKLVLEWWGKAVQYTVQDGDGSGKIGGAFLGHAQRHGGSQIERMDMRFM